ncbi:MAG: nuclear transport factor 2 family protein [Bacteroidetes bacterium]|nr:nuclear transport factor 2 family protein [Bacteroidota bacterium]MBS1607753.1 nuclear transport factor 2 family protein [Bacteroidota bacterium]
MKSLTEAVDAFNALVQQQKWAEALDTFYDDNIISADNENEPLKGLDKLKAGLKEFEANTKDISLKLKNVIVSDDMSVTEWHYIFTHSQWGRFDYDQLSLQRWKEGKIIHERHHYKTDKF